MTSAPTLHDLELFMYTRGWSPQAAGRSGRMWTREGDRLAVPTNDETPDYARVAQFVIQRLAEVHRNDIKLLEERITFFSSDVAEVVSLADQAEDGSIPLPAGLGLVRSAWDMIRASIAASRNPKPAFGRFTPSVLELAGQVRMGHTRRGSYALPVIMPLPAADEPAEQVFHTMTNADVLIDPVERRAMRTFATAARTLQQVVLDSEKEATQRTLNEVVGLGVSRDLCLAVLRAVQPDEVDRLNINFSWSPVLISRDLPGAATFPADNESRLLLRRAADKLRKPSTSKVTSASGPIVLLSRRFEAHRGRIGVETFVNGHQTQLDVDLDDPTYEDAIRWHGERRIVQVVGMVDRAPGKRPLIRKPQVFGPVEDIMDARA